MPRGFIPDIGKPRTTYMGPPDYLLGQVQAKFWQPTITREREYIKYLWDSEKKQTDETKPTIEINSFFLDDTFDSLPDEVKQMMDISDYINANFTGSKEIYSSTMGNQGGSASYEFKHIAGRYGTIEIKYKWSYCDEGYTYALEKEEYSISGVIHHNYRYYGITHEFIDWCQEADKANRSKWFRQLTYQA